MWEETPLVSAASTEIRMMRSEVGTYSSLNGPASLFRRDEDDTIVYEEINDRAQDDRRCVRGKIAGSSVNQQLG